MGENSGTEDLRPIAAPCARELSSDVRVDVEHNAPVSSVQTQIRLGRYRGWHESRKRISNVNSQGVSVKATVTTRFGSHDDVQMLAESSCGAVRQSRKCNVRRPMTNSGAELCPIFLTCARLDCNARPFPDTSRIKALVTRDWSLAALKPSTTGAASPRTTPH